MTTKQKIDTVEQDYIAIATAFLVAIGENINRGGLLDTPSRAARMWTESFRGYDPEQKPKITTFINGSDGLKYDQMVIDKGTFYSWCEHHMVPFFGTYFFAYIPNEKILGLSKVARIVDYHSARLQVQERLTKEIVDEFASALEPIGVALIMKARHLCKEMRGVKKTEGYMTTSDVRGVFREKPEARQELINLINL